MQPPEPMWEEPIPLSGRRELPAFPAHVYVVCALPPANRKSAVFALLADPLYEAEKKLQVTMAPAIVEAAMTARLAKEAADNAAAKAAKADREKREDLIAEAIGLAQTAEVLAVPVEPLLLADDSTSETVTSLIAEQGGRLAVMSAEGGIFDIIAGRYSGAPNMEVFLKGPPNTASGSPGRPAASTSTTRP
ncbi:DUF3987 domain-containing protein [Streptomyces sp. NPDC089922]|uniref:DUF3987 domain-containing protein n=1 Tax=Streptomyces sp. NPDC089922 TaxID=3155189 RepID=UPI00343223D9